MKSRSFYQFYSNANFQLLFTFTCGIVFGSVFLKSFYHLWLNFYKNAYSPLIYLKKNERSSSRCDVPDNAPEDCPGLESDVAGKAAACAGCPNRDICSSGASKIRDPHLDDIYSNMAQIKKKILVLSGKGGVGKSTVAAQLSWLLQERGLNIGILDIDICGPSIPIMTGSRGMTVHASADGWSPVYVESNLAVMSIGFLLSKESDAVIWRGPKKNGLIRQFLSDVTWGALDILIIDTPPGTSDEHLSIVTYLQEAKIDGALIVTTPQEVALMDVRKEITFCKRVNIPILGLIENMTQSVFDESENKDETQLTLAQKTCVTMEIPYAGAVPLDKSLLLACERGISITKINQHDSSNLLYCMNNLTDRLLHHLQISVTNEDMVK